MSKNIDSGITSISSPNNTTTLNHAQVSSVATQAATHQEWLAKTIAECVAHGHRITPVFKSGKTKPYAEKQTYTDIGDYADAVAVGLVLDNYVLLDYDGNKAKEKGEDIVSTPELAKVLRWHVDDLELCVAQVNDDGDSIHYLFAHNSAPKRQSCDGWLPYIDIKTGNQLMHIKPHKTLSLIGYENIQAPPKVIEQLLQTPTGNRTPWAGKILEKLPATEHIHSLLKHIDPDCPRDRWLRVLMAIVSVHESLLDAITLADQWSGGAFSEREGTPSGYCGYQDVEAVIQSFKYDHAVNLGTLIMFAREGGFTSIDQAEFDETLRLKLQASFESGDEYEKTRKPLAKQLGMRVSVLDDQVRALQEEREVEEELAKQVELFTEFEPSKGSKCAGSDLLDDIVGVLDDHMILVPEDADKIALWIMHTYAFKGFKVTPRLMITAPTPACGKSVLLSLVRAMSQKSFLLTGITNATFFRLANQYAPTVCVDEIDQLHEHSDIWHSINSGIEASTAVPRCQGDDNTLEFFYTHMPMATAGINADTKCPPATLSRSLVVHMQKALPIESRALVEYDAEDRAAFMLELGNDIARFIEDNKEALRRPRPVLPDYLHNREADKWRSLFAIAELVGGDWPKRVSAACEHEKGNTEFTRNENELLLVSIKKVLTRDDDFIPTSELLHRLTTGEDSDIWNEYQLSKRSGEGLTDRALSTLLGAFQVKSKREYVADEENKTPTENAVQNGLGDLAAALPKHIKQRVRGYKASALKKAIERYV